MHYLALLAVLLAPAVSPALSLWEAFQMDGATSTPAATTSTTGGTQEGDGGASWDPDGAP